MDTKQFDEANAEINALTAKLTAETSKIVNGNPYIPLVGSAAATLAMIAIIVAVF